MPLMQRSPAILLYQTHHVKCQIFQIFHIRHISLPQNVAIAETLFHKHAKHVQDFTGNLGIQQPALRWASKICPELSKDSDRARLAMPDLSPERAARTNHL